VLLFALGLTVGLLLLWPRRSAPRRVPGGPAAPFRAVSYSTASPTGQRSGNGPVVLAAVLLLAAWVLFWTYVR
jgi:hypothetical protein